MKPSCLAGALALALVMTAGLPLRAAEPPAAASAVAPAAPQLHAAMRAPWLSLPEPMAMRHPQFFRDVNAFAADLRRTGQLGSALGAFIAELQRLQRAVESRDVQAMEQFFNSAKQRRDGWNSQAGSPSPE